MVPVSLTVTNQVPWLTVTRQVPLTTL
uniref:Uncharacterized protein n=1 Tax=Arundo donax TaxID=35708 RepID=A0A0A9A831_ARUDO